MKKNFLSILLIISILLLTGCNSNNTKKLSNKSWVEEIDFSNTKDFDKPLDYLIMSKEISYAFPLDYKELVNKNDLFVLDTTTKYNDNYYHFMPYKDFYNSEITNWQVPLFQCIGEGSAIENQTQIIGVIEDDISNTYVFKTICVLGFLFDGKFDENNIPSCQVGVNCLAENGFIITTDISYDNFERHKINIIQLQDLIDNYLGKPDKIYCSCKLDEISNQTENIITYLIWEYDDGQIVTLQCNEINSDIGLKLQIGSFTYTPASWSKETEWIKAMDSLNSNYIDITNDILN